MKKIDTKWFKRNSDKWYYAYNRLFVFGLPLILIFIVFVISWTDASFKSLSKEGQKNIILPSETGFISKTNDLMTYLLKYTDESVEDVENISDLNQKYPALIFASPYKEGLYVDDIRIVGLKTDSIKDYDLKKFYENSNLPKVFEQQKNNLSQKFFKIEVLRNDVNRRFTIKNIEIIRSLFKISMEKDPWKNNIYAKESKLFSSSEGFVFLSYQNSVIPLKIDTSSVVPDNTYFKLDLNNNKITYKKSSSETSYYDNNYYEYYNDIKSKKYRVQFEIENKGFVNIFISSDSEGMRYLNIKLDRGLSGFIYALGNNAIPIKATNASNSYTKVKYQDGMKIVINNGQGDDYKIAEFCVTEKNPMILLSSLIQSNQGKERYTISPDLTDMFTQQIVTGLSTCLSNTEYNSDIHLTIDPILSREFEKELRDYKNLLARNLRSASIRNPKYEVSMTVMDMATGEIIAMPFVSDVIDNLPNELKLTRKNPALRRYYIGSSFKPMLALAAVHTNNNLLSFTRTGNYSLENGIANFLGTRGKIKKIWADKHWDRDRNMKTFLEKSDDVYPVALATLALSGKNGSFTRNGTRFNMSTSENSFFYIKNSTLMIKDDNPSNYLFFQNLDKLYNVNSFDSYADSIDAKTYFWSNIKLNDEDKEFGLAHISPDYTDMHYEELNRLDTDLRAWVLGQGNNEWNCAKLAEAWSRMLSKRCVKASFVVNESNSYPSLVDSLYSMRNTFVGDSYTIDNVNNTWNQFLDIFQQAQTENATYRKMIERFNEINYIYADSLMIFSKTGTPDEYKRTNKEELEASKYWIDLGMYSFAIMTKESYRNIKNNKPGKGIVCIIRVLRTFENTNDDPIDGLNSAHAVNFLGDDRDRLVKFIEMTKEYY